MKKSDSREAGKPGTPKSPGKNEPRKSPGKVETQKSAGKDEVQKLSRKRDTQESTGNVDWTIQMTEPLEELEYASSRESGLQQRLFQSDDHHQIDRIRRLAHEHRLNRSRFQRVRECHFVRFWKHLPHLLWSFFIEALYIPAYRFEWGKFRNWSYEEHGRRNYELDSKRIKEMEQRHERRKFIRMRRREAQIAGSALQNKHVGCRRVRLNCAGIVFESQLRTLLQFPDTLLGDPVRRMRYWNLQNGEYFFDQNPDCFESILHFYQSGGSRLERPQHMSIEAFREELKFFGIKGHRAEEFAEEVGDDDDLLDRSNLPRNLFKRKLWLLLEHPKSSAQARLFSYLSILTIVLSTFNYCINTMDMFRGSYSRNIEVVDIRDPLFFTETVCVIFFTLELLGRLYACPDKLEFVVSFSNIVDTIAIVPFVVEVCVLLTTQQTEGNEGIRYIEFEIGSILEGFHRLAKVISVFRILKLSRYSLGLRILGQTLHASLHELGLLAFFLLVGVILFSSALYFIESSYNPTTKFSSIPGTFFWAVSTMTTTGYDRNDELPKTVGGKVIGSICAIAGVLTLSLPVPVVVANFTYFYHRGVQFKKKVLNKKNKVKKKRHVTACPFSPTCHADHYDLDQAQTMGKKSQAGLKSYYDRAAKRRASTKPKV